MSTLFSAHAACPPPCTGTETENCLTSNGHLKITDTSLTGVGDYDGNLYVLSSAFKGCTALTSVSMSTVIEVRPSAFQDTSLTSVTMPRVTSVGASAFLGTELTSVTMISAPGSGVFENKVNFTTTDCPKQCQSQTTNCLYNGHLEITDNSLRGVSYVSGALVVGDVAFNGCTGIQTVNMPSVTSVGIGAFEGTGVTSVTMQRVTEIGDFAFYKTGVTGVLDLPSVTEIGNHAFYNTLLTKVDLPSVTKIGYSAFEDNNYIWLGTNLIVPGTLTEVYMPVVESIGERAFFVSGKSSKLHTVTMTSVKTIGERAFRECEQLTEVHMPVVESIGELAFDKCLRLHTVTMPSVKTIGKRAFRANPNNDWGLPPLLTNVVLPQVTDIGQEAFKDCTALDTVYMPRVVSIGANAFSGSNPTKVTKPATPGYSYFDNTPIINNCPPPCITSQIKYRTNCLDVGHLEITNDFFGVSGVSGTLVIAVEAFSGCTALTSVNMPSVTKIGAFAFQGTGLTNVSMPAVDEIGASAFQGTPLTLVSTPAVTKIGASAFKGTKLTSVSMPAVTKIDDFAFQDTDLNLVSMSAAQDIGASAFIGTPQFSLTITSGTDIGASAFQGTKLTSVSMPTVTEIGASAFQGTILSFVSMPSVSNIGASAFDDCRALTTVIKPKEASYVFNDYVRTYTATEYQEFLKSEYIKYSSC